jgi:hypothetical protein
VAGYSDPHYLNALSEFGEPRWLSNSSSGVLVQPIEGTEFKDARGPYPLLSSRNWAALNGELEEQLGDCVSFVGVSDPLSRPPQYTLRAAFPDFCHRYKDHYIVELSSYDGPNSQSHRRQVRNASRSIAVKELHPPFQALEKWLQLYNELSCRHRISGIARFSAASFAMQLSMPNMRLFQASAGHETVAMSLWLQSEGSVYYHLGASSEFGYSLKASYALFAAALQQFHEEGLEEALLGAGAGILGDPNDGLSRFKAGWATGILPSFLCGRILSSTAYSQLSKGLNTNYFPAYRDPKLKLAIAA